MMVRNGAAGYPFTGANSPASVWYKWVAPATGTLLLNAT